MPALRASFSKSTVDVNRRADLAKKKCACPSCHLPFRLSSTCIGAKL